MLDALAAMSTGTGLKKDIGTLVGDLGDALQLRESGAFKAERIDDFARHPATALMGRLPALLGEATADLVHALDPTGALVRGTAGTGTYTLAFGASSDPPAFSLTLDTTGGTPPFLCPRPTRSPASASIAVDALRLSAAGIVVEARLGPAALDSGRARCARWSSYGPAAPPGATGSCPSGSRSTTTPPESWSCAGVRRAASRAGRRTTTARAPTSTPTAVRPACSPSPCRWSAASCVGALGPSIVTPRLVRMLGGVLLVDGATTADVDPAFALDLLSPDLLLARAERLLWNVATDAQPLALTIDGSVTLSLAAEDPAEARSRSASTSR